MFTKHNFLNSIDDTVHWTSLEDFNASLVSHILFSGRIIVNEPLLFNSNKLASHIAQRCEEVSLFEAACKSGIIIPAFREKQHNLLSESEERFASYYGKDYAVISAAMKPFINDIVAAVDEGRKHTDAYHWPEDKSLGEKYLSTVRRLLQNEKDLNTLSPELRTFWMSTGEWRNTLIEKAAQRTVEKGALGLQRAEVVSLLGAAYGITKKDSAIQVSDLLTACTSVAEKKSISEFIRWLAVCKFIAEAEISNSGLNIPGYNGDLDHLLFQNLEEKSLISPPKQIRIEVEMPPISSLVAEKTNDLVAIRREYGHGYLLSLNNWADSPTDKNEERLVDTLQRYSKAITSRHTNSMNSKAFFSFTEGKYKPGLNFLGFGLTATAGLTGFSSVATCVGIAFAVINFTSGMRRLNNLKPETNSIEITSHSIKPENSKEVTT